MDAQWIKSPTARRILVHWADSRPAWLWSADGSRLIWRNPAARLFLGRVKKSGLKLAPDPIPIKGQVARLIRLGSIGRSSLSRIQFLAGDKPVSTTCTCTPLALENEEKVLLIVGVDAIDADLLDQQEDRFGDPLPGSLFPSGSEYLLTKADGTIAGGSAGALERFAPYMETTSLPDLGGPDGGVVEHNGANVRVTSFSADQHGAGLLLFEPDTPLMAAESIEDVRLEEGLDEEPDRAPTDEPMLPMGLAPLVIERNVPAEETAERWTEYHPTDEPAHKLSTLFDQLVEDAGLFTTLTEADDHFAGETALPPAAVSGDQAHPRDAIAEIIERAEAEAAMTGATTVNASSPVEEPAPVEEAATESFKVDTSPVDHVLEPELPISSEDAAWQPAAIWKVTGRGFVPATITAVAPDAEAVGSDEGTTAEEPEAAVPSQEEPVAASADSGPDRRELDRVSRYNFDELGRILTDRISGNHQATQAPSPQGAATSTGTRPSEGTLINLAGETFILNRLPLGILVFRDQQVLFANRALTDLTGHDSIDSLRTAGLTSIFPADDAATSGPVTHLVRRDGLLLPVNARLQSISWHGQPALMLSASLAEQRPVHEVAVKAFAELAAGLQEEGYIAADRGGIITQVSLHGRIVLGRDEDDLVGQPLSALVDPAGHAELRAFLERPARFAETARPGTVLAGMQPGIEVTLFAEGQAGIVSGYFGFVRRRDQAAAPADREDVIDTEVLSRVSRGVRRPLNTIIGFADLIRSAAFGPIDIPRYLEYAADIQEAGREIAGLIDEIDDLTQLSAGSYVAKSDALDLVALLDTCVMRVRPQAAARRVLVRSAVSERLPRVRADRASLTQAILNLLASAVDQSPASGTVIVSAQPDDSGGITINVRDSAAMHGDIDERFVVFREDEANGGATLAPVRSSVGLALTRSLLAVNALKLTVDPVIGVGTLFSLSIPAELTVTD